MLVGEGKRFMAYDIVNNLLKANKTGLLKVVKQGVNESELKVGKKHQVFELSFDARKCFDRQMVEQKLDYIHYNPVNGKWALVEDFVEYQHSSAAFYELGSKNKYVTHYRDVC